MTIQEYLEKLLKLLLFDAYSLEIAEDDQYISIDISLPESDSGILIGHHGETLTALRRILHSTFVDYIGEKRILLNVNDYRDEREQKIRELIDRGINHIGNSHRSYHLYRLNSAERFFAHNLIASEPDYQSYTSYSIDDEDGQRVLVIEHRSEWTPDDYT
ncbi:KH domain-containing protein [bacterium]|nr:KH domain-containing protein [bacterium]